MQRGASGPSFPPRAVARASPRRRHEASPKQYAALPGATVLEWSLRALLAEPRVHAVVVGLAADDAHWPAFAPRLDSPKLQTTDRRRQSAGLGGERLGFSGGAARGG